MTTLHQLTLLVQETELTESDDISPLDRVSTVLEEQGHPDQLRGFLLEGLQTISHPLESRDLAVRRLLLAIGRLTYRFVEPALLCRLSASSCFLPSKGRLVVIGRIV